MIGNITDIDDARPHATTAIVCDGCNHKWIAVYPIGTKALECPGCHNAVNEYGTRVLLRRCKTCGARFTVVPVPENPADWEHCMAETCASYDETRDATKLFDAGMARRDDDDT